MFGGEIKGLCIGRCGGMGVDENTVRTSRKNTTIYIFRENPNKSLSRKIT